MAGVLYAMFLIESVLYTFLLTETLATFVGISVLGGIIWPRANRWGALASLLSALATNFILYYVTGQRLDHWDAERVSRRSRRRILALVVVSLAHESGAGEQDRLPFFARLQTSSDGPGRLEIAAVDAAGRMHASRSAASPGQSPPPAVPPPRAAAGARSAEDLVGFAAGWAIVIVPASPAPRFLLTL